MVVVHEIIMYRTTGNESPPSGINPGYTGNTGKFDSTTLKFVCSLLDIVLRDYNGPVAVRLWNDQVVTGKEDAPCCLVFREPYPLCDLLLTRNINYLAEAHLDGDVDTEGDLELVFDLLDFVQGRVFTPFERLTMFILATRLLTHRGKTGSRYSGYSRDENTRDSIAYHYDISNEFYTLFLDPEMVYSCAYFSDPSQSLAQAQQDKLDYICRKLRLQPGQKLLDVGCGWGGLAFRAARNHGVNVHGITLSRNQYEYATARAIELGLNEKVSFELRDYRELEEGVQYDRIVSVGMFEHIGIGNFPVYFHAIRKLLKPDGLFLNHGITNDTGWLRTPVTQFINTYIFPDGELARVSDVSAAMEKEGFEILDEEALRPHYVLTLRNWVRALEKNRMKAIAIAGERNYKLWRLYMAGSAYYFNQGSTGIYQILAGINRHPWVLPLRRSGLYTKG